MPNIIGANLILKFQEIKWFLCRLVQVFSIQTKLVQKFSIQTKLVQKFSIQRRCIFFCSNAFIIVRFGYDGYFCYSLQIAIEKL